MRKLAIDKKTGFKVRDIYKPIIIRDERNILFYSNEDVLPRTVEFNLPAGNYYIDSGWFTEMATPVKYALTKLPNAQRWFYPSVKNFDLVFCNNENKCSIDWQQKVIFLDYAFENKPWPIIDFILSHEIGHKFYGTEKFADLFASNRMLIKGYNPLQIGYAQLDSLSHRQRERKNYLTEKIADTYEKTRYKL